MISFMEGEYHESRAGSKDFLTALLYLHYVSPMGNMGEHHLGGIFLALAALFLLLLLVMPPWGQAQGSGLPEAPGPEVSGPREWTLQELPKSRIVGIQAGHWKAEDQPDSMAELRSSTGAVHEAVQEVDLNLDVATRTVTYLVSRGIPAELVPAVVPPGYRAEALVSLHADWASQPRRRGWKTSPPWRPSPASLDLESSLRSSFQKAQFPEDRGGVTVNMRGYYGFNHRYYSHAAAPETPAVLVEMGFLTNDLDRMLMTDGAQSLAEVIGRGVEEFWQGKDRRREEDYRIPDLPPARVGPAGAVLRDIPGSHGSRKAGLSPGQWVFQLQKNGDGWVEVFIRDPRPDTGWVHPGDLVQSRG